MTIFDILNTFNSVFAYILYTVKMPLIYWLHSEADSSLVFTLSKNIDILWEMKTLKRNNIENIVSQRMSIFFESVNFGELPTCECNQ